MAKHIILTVVVLLFAVFSVSAQKPVHGVIITRQNNHNWPVSHQAIKMTLENSGLFSLDVAISPKQGEDMSDFSVGFCNYKLVVLDYNGDNWPEAMNAAFMDYVQRGGGVVVYHAADNAFTDWKGYNEMIALGGWGGRNQMSQRLSLNNQRSASPMEACFGRTVRQDERPRWHQGSAIHSLFFP